MIAKPLQSALCSPHEKPLVLFLPDDVHKDFTSAILLPLNSIEPAQIKRHITAVANREHTAVHHFQIVRLPVGRVQYNPVRHTDVAGRGSLQLAVDGRENALFVKFVVDVEVLFHKKYY